MREADLCPLSAGVIGCVQPLGSIMPVSEMQARVFCAVLSGRLRLPRPVVMAADSQRKAVAMGRRYRSSPRHTIQVQWDPFVGLLPPQLCLTCALWRLAS